MCIYQFIELYTVNVYIIFCQLYLNEAGLRRPLRRQDVVDPRAARRARPGAEGVPSFSPGGVRDVTCGHEREGTLSAHWDPEACSEGRWLSGVALASPRRPVT